MYVFGELKRGFFLFNTQRTNVFLVPTREPDPGDMYTIIVISSDLKIGGTVGVSISGTWKNKFSRFIF